MIGGIASFGGAASAGVGVKKWLKDGRRQYALAMTDLEVARPSILVSNEHGNIFPSFRTVAKQEQILWQ